MSQLHTLTKYIEDFYRDRTNPAHEYLKILNGDEIGQPLKVFILAENGHKVNSDMDPRAAYLFTLDIKGTEWPKNAPRGWIDTENGMYQPGHNICTSNGTYHPESYVVVPFETQIMALFMAMCTNDKMLAHGISVVSYSDKRGPDIARKSFKSRAWTMSKFGDIVKAIEGKYAEYSARWPRLPAGADPTRYIIVKTGRGRGAVEEYVALDPGVEKGNGELVIVGEVAVPPAGFSAIDYPRVVNKAGIDTSSWVLPAGVSMVVEENIDDLAGLL